MPPAAPLPPLGDALAHLAKAHRARLAELLAPHGLHPGQDTLLLVLWAQPGLRQAEVARRLAIEPPTVTRMVQRLERSGLIERRPDPHDARLVRLFPTPRARLLEGAVRRAWQEVESTMAGALGSASAPAVAMQWRAAAEALRPSADPAGE